MITREQVKSIAVQAYELGMANPRGNAIASKGEPLIGWPEWLEKKVDQVLDNTSQEDDG